jgi:hypothetical protein
MKYTCPVCDYENLQSDPKQGTHEICPNCEIQFGFDDVPEPKQSSGFLVNEAGVATPSAFQSNTPLRTRESLWAAWRDTWLKGRLLQ